MNLSFDWESTRIKRAIYLFLLTCLVYRFLLHALPHQVLQPVLINTKLDITYWVFVSSALHLWLAGSTGALLLQAALFIFPITGLFFPQRALPGMLTTGVLLLYHLFFNLYSGSHAHLLIGPLLISVALWWKKEQSFQLVWEGLRYYTLFIYVSAFLWKVFFYGSFWHWNQGVTLIRMNTLDLQLYHPDAWFTHIYQWVTANEWIANSAEKALTLLELFPIVGFFTRKYDKVIFLSIIIIHALTSFFMDVFFFEYFALWCTLLIIPKRSENHIFRNA